MISHRDHSLAGQRHPSPTDFKGKLQAIFFFLLLMSALALAYIATDSNRVFASVAAAKIARMLDSMEPAKAPPPGAAQPAAVPAAGPIQTASALGAGALGGATGATATPLLQTMPASDPPLTMMPVAAISTTGACYAIEGLKSDARMQSAKALLASGPLREKSWAVSTPFAAQYAAGIEAEGAPSARRIARALADRGVEPLSMSAKFIVLAKSDSEPAALELANASLAGIPGYAAKTRMVSAGGERRSLVALARTRNEIQFAASLPSRLPGATLSPVPCPQAAIATAAPVPAN